MAEEGSIPNFDLLLAQQIQEEEQARVAKTKSRKKANYKRYLENLTPAGREALNRANRIAHRVAYKMSSAKNNKRTHADMEADALKLLQDLSKNQEEDDKKAQALDNAIVQELVKNGGRLDKHAARLDKHGALVQQALNDRRVENELRRKKQMEDRAFAFKYLQVVQNGTVSDAPEPVPSVLDTPLKPTTASTVAVMPTPDRIQFKRAESTKRMLQFDGIGEGEEYQPPPPPEMRLTLAMFGEESLEFYETSIHAKIDAFTQVLDCSVILHDRKLVPVKYLKKFVPTFTQQATGTLNVSIPQVTCEMTNDGLAPLRADEPIIKVESNGPFLLGKGMLHSYLWKYIPHTGTFLGPTKFAMEAEGAQAVNNDSIVSFGVDLFNSKFNGLLRQVSFHCQEKQLVVEGEKKVDGMALDKGRVKAKMVCGLGHIFLLAFKQPNKTTLTGHLFADNNGKFVKFPGFAEGEIADIAVGSHLFARKMDGKVYYLDTVDWNVLTVKWKEFKDSESQSMDLSSICACDHGCFGVEGTKAFFLIPMAGLENACTIIDRSFDGIKDIAHLDGSGSYAAFLAPVDNDPKADESSATGGEDDSKPAAVAK